MKKSMMAISFLFLTLCLTSCHIPGDVEPTPDLLSTQVAKLLTESATAITLSPSETMAPSPTHTEPVLEATPTETATSTETPTATQDQNDPAQRLGAATWTEDFNGSSSPWDYESPQANFKPSNGALVLIAKANANWHSWYVSSPKLKDAYVEATIQMSNCSGRDRMGLVVRGTSDWMRFYYMGVTCDGQWGFFRMDADVNISEISAYQPADPLGTGMNNPHRIGIWMEGTNFTFYIDGEKVGEASDTTLSGEGFTGFLIAYANTPGYSVRIEQLRYWNIP